MNLSEYDSRADAIEGRTELHYCCESGHEVTVYSSDPYYPDWVDCPECGKLMDTELCD